MTVDELLAKLNAAFPAFNARALEAWAGAFREALGKHEGPALKGAYTAVLGSFTPKASKALHPMVADFLAHLPGGHPKIADSGPPLDFTARGERVRKLMAEWRAGQGLRAAGGNPVIMQALERMVEPLANLWGWSENPNPIRLTVKQVRRVQQRAISQERVRRFGPLPKTNAVWWEQIQTIASEWKINVRYEDWGQPSKSEAA